ncbi:hypothetical protein DJ568_08850 [Mucilaginibacter hurinus]|uniref:Ricin B lectin domain-containing protein n=1 Tax=Mucilaginibacter hurinus TaxID=2201324 RepID=A0A367GRF4_9SPHI|nr:RICIN domain-containing protein [Mucilaginibacter hurinus]RCH55281.1 hypothetical protein DJ568_08850 [Mucilaginibacter hurinus]
MKKQLTYVLAAACCLVAAGCKKNESLTARQKDDQSAKRVMVGEMTGVLPTGAYKLVTYVTAPATNKAVGIIGGLSGTADGVKIEQRGFMTNKAQEWRITSLGSGEYSIVNINSGKCIDIPFGNAVSGAEVWQYPYTGDNAQKWIITDIGSGVYQIKAKLNNTLGLNVTGGSTADGVKISLNSLTTNNSKFYIYRVAYKDKVATDFFKRTTGWTAGDGAMSIGLSDGRTLWNFGDCHQNDYSAGTVPCLFNVNSCAIVQPSGNWNPASSTLLLGPTNPNDGKKNLYRSNATAEYFNWPTHGTQIGTTAYIMSDVWHYTHIPAGTTQQVYDKPQWIKVNTSSITTAPTYVDLPVSLNPNSNGGIEWGFGLIKESDGYLYVYGRKQGGFGVGAIYVARILQSAPENVSGWTFWNGSSWVSTVASAVSIGEAPTTSFHISKVGSKYLCVVSHFALTCLDNAQNIYTATASAKTGPFPSTAGSSSWKVIYQIDERAPNGNFPSWYLPIAHHQFTANNELLIIYSVNGYGAPLAPACYNECNGSFRKDPDTYRPKAIRVPLKLIDSSL